MASMCRLLAVVSSHPVAYHLYLRDAPKSLARLAHEHPDGWGAAICEQDTGWAVFKRTASAKDDSAFHELAVQSRGVLLIAHIRQRTVGPVGIANTHPFLRDGWVFAHNGTIKDIEYLTTHSSKKRSKQVEGDTDSERLFAFILTRLDDGGEADEVIATAVAELRARENFGAFNFILAREAAVYVHRCGRSLFLLDKAARAPEQTRVSSETGSVLDVPELEGQRAIFIASEAMTDEAWQEIPDGTLLRLQREPRVSHKKLSG